jgi:capsular polysaccharide biosynthesis protein
MSESYFLVAEKNEALRNVYLRPVSYVASPHECAGMLGPNCQDSRCLAPAGFYDRKPPLLLDSEEATGEARQALARYFAVSRQHYPERLALLLAGAYVTGQGAVVTNSGNLIAETVATFTAHSRVPIGLNAIDANTYSILPATRRIERPCLLAKAPWYRNYGHCLVDCATVIAMASALGLCDGTTIVIGTYQAPAMEHVIQTILREFAGRSEVLIHPDNEVWEFGTLWYVTPLHVPPLFKLPDGLRALRSSLLPSARAPSSPSQRLFVSRGDKAHRHLMNENELLGMCVKNGFDLVYPERLSLHEQAALFQDAQVIVGVKGAALTNALFMAPGAAVIALSPADFPDPFFWDICAQFDVQYLEIFGDAATGHEGGRADFSVRPDKLSAALSLIGATPVS